MAVRTTVTTLETSGHGSSCATAQIVTRADTDVRPLAHACGSEKSG